MNRAKRDYCAIGSHPNWRAVSARRDDRNPVTRFLGNYGGAYCDFCHAEIKNFAADPPRHVRLDRSYRFFGATYDVSRRLPALQNAWDLKRKLYALAKAR